jgi:hypothetical protein
MFNNGFIAKLNNIFLIKHFASIHAQYKTGEKA